MALAEDIIFTDPVLQRISFDERRFAPRFGHVADINILEHDITDAKVRFLKAKRLEVIEPLQIKMRQCWFEIRTLCDGYFIKMPAGHDDGCEHVQVFAHDNLDTCFRINGRTRVARWYKHCGRPPTIGLERFTPRI